MEKGFKLNPYDRCGANKLVNGKWFTLVWYVDNNRVSHMEAKVVEDLIKYLNIHFRDLLVTRGKKNTFWGMNINITEDKKFDIEIKEKFLKSINKFGRNVDLKVTTLAYSHIFIVNKQAQQLYVEKSEIFRLVVEKLLYIMRRSRPDWETAILFLYRRESKSDVDDWKT